MRNVFRVGGYLVIDSLIRSLVDWIVTVWYEQQLVTMLRKVKFLYLHFQSNHLRYLPLLSIYMMLNRTICIILEQEVSSF